MSATRSGDASAESSAAEPLFLANRGCNRPSYELAAGFIDSAAALCCQAGLRSLLFRGDTGFTQIRHLDRWDDAGDIRFCFVIDARPNRVALAEQLPAAVYGFLKRPVREIKTAPRQRPERHKERI